MEATPEQLLDVHAEISKNAMSPRLRIWHPTPTHAENLARLCAR